ncbi:MAG TPA: replicative DNA helicase [Acidimicrobiia bacterium]|nr:replicative DNA helicase [Acidimicrobiia bacterium]
MSGMTDQGQLRPGFRSPPHSREAEESVIGAVLLSEEAVNEVMDRLHPPDFYVPAHQAIFEAMRELFDTNQAIDAVTVSEALRRRGELEKVGGVAYLTRLVDIVPSTSNILYYSGIVEEHAKRRELIRAGASVTDVAFDIDEEIAHVLDRAEQAVLSVAERRSAQTLLEVGPLFSDVLEHIELLEQRGSELTGLATGYVDLDKKLAGLQAANLVVIAARPAMGKSSLALGIAVNAAVQQEPVAIFSLEMSKEEIVQRILSSVGRVDSMKLRSGQLGPLWQRVVDAAGKMYQAPIYIDDSPVVTVTDIRAKCRRLKRKKGLSLVVIDYLQLMEASSRENRQQEISEITRNLKNLARELEVPVIAVSQLNRSLEAREDKRPRLSDLRESGCLTADTRLVRADTNVEMTLGELVATGASDIPVWSLDDRYKLVPSRLTKAFSSGVKPAFEMELASGRTIQGSGNHPFLTVDGWVRLDDLEPGDRIAVTRRLADSRAQPVMTDDQIVVLAQEANPNVDTIPASVWTYIRHKAMPAAGVSARELAKRLGMSYCGSTLYKSGISRARMRRLASVLDDDYLDALAESDVLWDRVVSITPVGEQEVFDATVELTHNFVANGIVAHNSIEQDADVVMFIYRHEYYHPEDQDRKGIAEVIVAKHRAGSTGPVEVTFQPEFTRFANLGRDVT